MRSILTSYTPWLCSMRAAASAPVRPDAAGTSAYFLKVLRVSSEAISDSTKAGTSMIR